MNNEQMHEFAVSLDDETLTVAGRIARSIAAELGESPEAWRGAAVITRNVMHAVIVEIETLGNISPLGKSLIVPMAMLADHPCWPKTEPGQSGWYDEEDLIFDDEG